MQRARATGSMRSASMSFVLTLMNSVAEATMDFMVKDAPQAEAYAASGFEAFWNAITA